MMEIIKYALKKKCELLLDFLKIQYIICNKNRFIYNFT